MSHNVNILFTVFFAKLLFVNSYAIGQTGDQALNWAYSVIMSGQVEAKFCEIPQSVERSISENEVTLEWKRISEAMKKSDEGVYDPARDYSKRSELLERARSGDSDAVQKLHSYVLMFNPKWRHRFEIQKLVSSQLGADGVAIYYSMLLGSRRDFRYKRMLSGEIDMVESGVNRLMEEADSGGLEQSFALYRFFGYLSGYRSEVKEKPLWGDSADLAVKYLDLAYQIGGEEKVDVGVRNHTVRLGFLVPNGQKIYPHTPDGWKPSTKKK